MSILIIVSLSWFFLRELIWVPAREFFCVFSCRARVVCVLARVPQTVGVKLRFY